MLSLEFIEDKEKLFSTVYHDINRGKEYDKWVVIQYSSS
jgi:hypothetical protein